MMKLLLCAVLLVAGVVMGDEDRMGGDKRRVRCPGCHCTCSKLMDPICAVDYDGKQKTFNNQCLLDNYNACYKKGFTELYRGPCRVYEEK